MSNQIASYALGSNLATEYFVPDPDLIRDIEECFEEFGSLKNHERDSAAVYGMFGSGFRAQLSWFKDGGRGKLRRAESQRKFAGRLSAIFERLDARVADGEDAQENWKRFCHWLPHYHSRAKIISGLNEFKNRFSARLEFPGYMRLLIPLVADAHEEVLIVVDGVDHGSFRDFERHRELIAALCCKAVEFKEQGARKGNEKRVQILIVVSKESMSWANKFRWKNVRNENREKFLSLLDTFLDNIQHYKAHFLREFEDVWKDRKVAWLPYATDPDDVNDTGEIKRLFWLQREYHDYVLEELLSAGVVVSMQPIEEKKLELTGTSAETASLPELAWIVDETKSIIVRTRLEQDAKMEPAQSQEDTKSRAAAFRRQFDQAAPISLEALRSRKNERGNAPKADSMSTTFKQHSDPDSSVGKPSAAKKS